MVGIVILIIFWADIIVNVRCNFRVEKLLGIPSALCRNEGICLMKAVQQKCICPVGFNGSACEKIVVENKVNMKNNQKTPVFWFTLRFVTKRLWICDALSGFWLYQWKVVF